MGVFPPQEKRSVPMLNSMVVCRYLQSWLTVAMKCRVMYSYSRQPSLPAEQQRTTWMRAGLILKLELRIRASVFRIFWFPGGTLKHASEVVQFPAMSRCLWARKRTFRMNLCFGTVSLCTPSDAAVRLGWSNILTSCLKVGGANPREHLPVRSTSICSQWWRKSRPWWVFQ